MQCRIRKLMPGMPKLAGVWYRITTTIRKLADTYKSIWQRVHIDFDGPFLGRMWLAAIDAKSRFPYRIC